MVKIKFEKSKNPKKKYDAYVYSEAGKLLHKTSFGAIGYGQYFDQIGLYSKDDHRDKDRRERFRARHGKIRMKDGQLAYTVKYSPEWYSWNYLW